MIIPNLQEAPIGMTEDGRAIHLHPEWRGMFTNLISQLQQNLSNEGIVAPQQPTSNIIKLTNSLPGTFIYDNTTHQAKVVISTNGNFRVIQTS